MVMKMAIQPTRSNSATLVDLIDRILDKGIVINADITVSICGVELLGVKVRAAVASFETAAKYGLDFPSGTNLNTESWQKIDQDKESCPSCNKKSLREELLRVGCPWCGWTRPMLVSGQPSVES
jgi:gas vesicle structural protein